MHIMDPREDPLVIYQLEDLSLNNWESLVLRYSPMVICQAEMDMESLRVIH